MKHGPSLLPLLLLSAGTLAAGMLIASCSSKSGNDAELQDGTVARQVLHYGNYAEPEDLDPHIVTGVPEHHIIDALFEGLVSGHPKDLSPQPGMAESWTVSDDGLVYTFTIRADAAWSNGDPLTARDFEYSWRRILTPTLASKYSYMLFYVRNAESYNKGELTDFSQVGARAVDDRTFEVTLANATPFFLQLLFHYSTYPVHQATIEKFGGIDKLGSQWTRPGNMVCNGPFTLQSWDVNKKVVVQKNPAYWDAEKVRLEEIHFYPTESQQAEERAFRAGQLQRTQEVPLSKIPVYQKEHPEQIHIDPWYGTYYYRFNVTRPPLDNPLVRKALALSVDRKLIVERVMRGGQIPAFSMAPPEENGYQPRLELSHNVEEAKRLLAEAGYPDGAGFPGIDILINTQETHKVVAEAIQRMWKENLNIDVKISNQDWKVYLSSMRALQYDVARAGWIGDYVDPNTFLDLWLTDGGNNQTGWSNTDYDRLIAQANSTMDPQARIRAFQDAEEILMTEIPVMPIYFYSRVYLLSPDVKGWYPNYLDLHPYKYVYLEETLAAN